MVQRTRIQGARELDRLLRALPKEIGFKVLAGAVMSGAQVIRKPALDRLEGGERGDVIARRTRKGQASVTVSVGPPRAKFALIFKEFGTQPHRITPRARGGKTLLADPETGAVFGPSVEHPGQPARPFLRPAFDAKVGAALDKIGEQLGKRLEKAAVKLAGRFKTSGLARRRRRRR